MQETSKYSRRILLKGLAVSGAMIPLLQLGASPANAADLPLVSADDPTAKSLHYVDDASKATGAKPGSKCGNCVLYQGAVGSKAGACPIFPGKYVKAAGWCGSWTAKP